MHLVNQMTRTHFSDILGLHPQLLKTLQSHKGEIGVLLLNEGDLCPHPRAGAACQRTSHAIR